MSNDNRVLEVRTSQSEAGREQRILTFKASQWIWLLFGILEALIVLRIGLKLIGANVKYAVKKGTISVITDKFADFGVDEVVMDIKPVFSMKNVKAI